jgi:hypothetical protein
MRHGARWGVLAAVTALGLSGATPAIAGGGGHGGVCYQAPPELDAGWIAVGDSCFSPRDTEVVTGDVVRWSLEGQAPHTVTFDGGPDSGALTGDGFAIRFNTPGTYAYSCSFHAGMVGTISAVGDGVSGPALEVLGLPAVAASGGGTTSGGAPTVLGDSVPMRVEFSPLAAVVVLAVGLPLSLGLAVRLVGVARAPAGYRLRLPWESRRAQQTPARR